MVDPDQISKYLLGESKNGWSWTYGWCALLFRKVQYYGRLPLEILVTFPEEKDGGKICFLKIYVGGEGQGFFVKYYHIIAYLLFLLTPFNKSRNILVLSECGLGVQCTLCIFCLCSFVKGFLPSLCFAAMYYISWQSYQ